VQYFFLPQVWFLSLVCLAASEGNKKSGEPVDRAYHLTPQGIQFFSSGNPALVYPNVPTVYIPSQVNLLLILFHAFNYIIIVIIFYYTYEQYYDLPT